MLRIVAIRSTAAAALAIAVGSFSPSFAQEDAVTVGAGPDRLCNPVLDSRNDAVLNPSDRRNILRHKGTFDCPEPEPVAVVAPRAPASAAEEAIGARENPRVVAEYGGVYSDADVEAAARVAIDARFQNAGQSCIAAKRFIAVDAVADEFQERFRNGIEELAVGDPSNPATRIGPLAKNDLVDTLEEQVHRSVGAGAQRGQRVSERMRGGLATRGRRGAAGVA